MPFTVSSGQKADQVAVGTYPATLEAVNIVNLVGFSGVATDFHEWHFLANVNGELTPISGLTSMFTGPASKTNKWLAALLRRELKAGEQLDDPIGQQCLVVVGINKKGYSNVTDVLPAPQQEMSDLIPGVPR